LFINFQVQESQQPAADAGQQQLLLRDAADDLSPRQVIRSWRWIGTGSNCVGNPGHAGHSAGCGAQVRQHPERPRLPVQSASPAAAAAPQPELQQQQPPQSEGGNPGLVPQRRPDFGGLEQAAREEDAPPVSAQKSLQPGLGPATLEGEVEEKALHPSLRSAAAGDAVSVG